LIIVGYSLGALGSIVEFIWTVSQNYFPIASAKSDFLVAANPLALLASVWAWWFLTKILVALDDQPSLLNKALFGLGLQSLVLGASSILVVSSLSSFSELNFTIWAFGVGYLITALGFFLMTSSTSKFATINDESLRAPTNDDDSTHVLEM
jgi:hypothetical protein